MAHRCMDEKPGGPLNSESHFNCSCGLRWFYNGDEWYRLPTFEEEQVHHAKRTTTHVISHDCIDNRPRRWSTKGDSFKCSCGASWEYDGEFWVDPEKGSTVKPKVERLPAPTEDDRKWRRAILWVSPHMLIPWFTKGNFAAIETVEGLPPDVELHHAFYDHQREQLGLVLTSTTFEPLAEGMLMPCLPPPRFI